MKYRISVLLLLALLLTVFMPAVTHAELARGSSGDDVATLQMMLYDMGYLLAEPDGQFGARTEEGVKEYQRSYGLEETGVVTDELMEMITQDWNDYINWMYEQLELDAGGNYAPFCHTWDEDGHSVTEYCEKHALLWSATQDMLAGGDADSALYSYYEWQAEVISLYNEWIALVSAPVQAELETNKALCIQLMDAQQKAMFAAYEATGSEIDPGDVYYGAELWMRSHCAWICQMLSTLESE